MNEIERNEKTEKGISDAIAELKKVSEEFGEDWKDGVLRLVKILMANSEVKQ